MNDTVITLQGWLGGDVSLRQAGESAVASFRLACTPRHFNRRTENWSDGMTQWYTVNVWRGLADNCAVSLRRGDPVVVQGRLELRTYVNANKVEVTTFEVEATHVGHDLSRGTSVFTRAAKTEVSSEQATSDSGEAVGESAA